MMVSVKYFVISNWCFFFIGDTDILLQKFVRLKFGVLCKNIRVPIPSCVVTAIRGKFSVEAGESFEGFHYIDETV